MRAITVVPLPGRLGPPRRGARAGAEHGRGAGRRARAGGLRDRHRDHRRRVRLGAAGRGAADARPRVARPRARGPRGQRLRARRSRRRHRAPARSGAVRLLRARRVGHLPQRPLHRARDQGAPRLRLRALARASRTSRCKLDPGLEPTSACCSSRRASSPRRGSRSSGSAAARASSPQRVLVTGAGPIGLLAALLGAPARLEVHVLDRVTDGPKPELVARPRRARTTTARSRDVGRRPTSSIEATGVGQLVFDAIGAHRAQRHRLPHRRLAGRAQRRPRRRRPQPRDGAGERRRLRLGQRQPAPLPDRRRGARRRPTATGCARLITRRVPLERWQEALERRPDDVKVVVALDARASAVTRPRRGGG